MSTSAPSATSWDRPATASPGSAPSAGWATSSSACTEGRGAAADPSAAAPRWPRQLFWKILAACWCTSIGTGLGIHLFARLWPGLIDLPPTPPRLSQSLGMPLLAGALCACAISALMAWRLARPLSLLRVGFRSAAAGRLDTRIAPSLSGPADEFSGLARDFDGMAAQLQQLMQARQRLLHDVSHELRSPLARLQVACELLRRQPADPARAIARIEREIARMDALVSDVLTLARLEAGPCPPEADRVDIAALLDRVVQDARFEAQASGHTLRWSPPDAPCWRPAQSELLRRAFDNVLRNALKHGPPDQPVEVTLQRQDDADALCIRIADRGPGLSPQDCEAVLQPFVRGSTAATSGRGAGHGLGLSIAARALQAHGGQLRLQPREGGGLCASMTLPVEAPMRSSPAHPAPHEWRQAMARQDAHTPS